MGSTWHAVALSNLKSAQSAQDVHEVLQIAQTAAVLEVAHAAARLVRSPLATTAQQVASRIFVVWGILWAVPGVAAKSLVLGRYAADIACFRPCCQQNSACTTSGPARSACNLYVACDVAREPPVGVCSPVLAPRSLTLGNPYRRIRDTEIALNMYSLLIAWGVTEVIRYSFYAFKQVGEAPAVLTWLRYTTFIVLYPLGVSSELAMVWLALPLIRKRGIGHYPMPNALNMSFSWYWVCIAIAMFYVPGARCRATCGVHDWCAQRMQTSLRILRSCFAADDSTQLCVSGALTLPQFSGCSQPEYPHGERQRNNALGSVQGSRRFTCTCSSSAARC